MKKCYKAPEVVVVDLDLENVCDAFKGSDVNAPGKPGEETDAASYRSSLWND